ncbi:hypothetical protein SBRY_120085 [Actinacidiphila bryophytorum]|uniref:Uncharacterized protein n=1 Tax=Actinacidiphila bryophytorum TaxID=1436133 RepID=A0A9W4ECY0_9ACTN|nr:hypothetical protein SBRY_120085 [Actinacidiphila bryophytorum]
MPRSRIPRSGTAKVRLLKPPRWCRPTRRSLRPREAPVREAAHRSGVFSGTDYLNVAWKALRGSAQVRGRLFDGLSFHLGVHRSRSRGARRGVASGMRKSESCLVEWNLCGLLREGGRRNYVISRKRLVGGAGVGLDPHDFTRGLGFLGVGRDFESALVGPVPLSGRASCAVGKPPRVHGRSSFVGVGDFPARRTGMGGCRARFLGARRAESHLRQRRRSAGPGEAVGARRAQLVPGHGALAVRRPGGRRSARRAGRYSGMAAVRGRRPPGPARTQRRRVRGRAGHGRFGSPCPRVGGRPRHGRAGRRRRDRGLDRADRRRTRRGSHPGPGRLLVLPRRLRRRLVLAAAPGGPAGLRPDHPGRRRVPHRHRAAHRQRHRVPHADRDSEPARRATGRRHRAGRHRGRQRLRRLLQGHLARPGGLLVGGRQLGRVRLERAADRPAGARRARAQGGADVQLLRRRRPYGLDQQPVLLDR